MLIDQTITDVSYSEIIDCTHTVNPLLSPPGAYLFQAHLRGGEGGGDLFNLENTMVSVLHKDLEYKVEKLTYKKAGGHATED